MLITALEKIIFNESTYKKVYNFLCWQIIRSVEFCSKVLCENATLQLKLEEKNSKIKQQNFLLKKRRNFHSTTLNSSYYKKVDKPTKIKVK